MSIDFTLAVPDYSDGRPAYPKRLYDRLRDRHDIGRSGQRVVDIGCGTGNFSRTLAARGCTVTGVDCCKKMIASAEEIDGKENLRSTKYVRRDAESTGLPSHSFDAAVSAQAWHWFTSTDAAVEIRRLLVPDGKLAIVHMDWIQIPRTNVVARTEELIDWFDPENPKPWRTIGGGIGVYGRWLSDLVAVGFSQVESFSFDLTIPFAREQWLTRLKASNIAARLSPEMLGEFLSALGRAIQDESEPFAIPHRVFCVVGISPALPVEPTN